MIESSINHDQTKELGTDFNTNSKDENCGEDGDDATLFEPVLRTTELAKSWQKRFFVPEK